MTASRLLALAACLLVACVRNPVTGKRQLALVSSEQEIALGKQSAEEVRQTMGTYDDPKVRAYVSGVGMRMATSRSATSPPVTRCSSSRSSSSPRWGSGSGRCSLRSSDSSASSPPPGCSFSS